MLQPSKVTQNTVKTAKLYADPTIMGDFRTQTIPKKADWKNTNCKVDDQ